MRINSPVTDTERLYSSTLQLISLTNKKGITTHANEVFIDVSGFSRDELTGKKQYRAPPGRARPGERRGSNQNGAATSIPGPAKPFIKWRTPTALLRCIESPGVGGRIHSNSIRKCACRNDKH
jgi:hypothetical protein